MRAGVRRRWLRSIPDSRDVAEPLDGSSSHVPRRAYASVVRPSHPAESLFAWYIMTRKQYTSARQRGDAEYNRCYEKRCKTCSGGPSKYELLVQLLYLFTALVVCLPVVVLLLLRRPLLRLPLLLLVWAHHDATGWSFCCARMSKLFF